MPLMRQPNPMPSPLNYVPANSEPYRVKAGDSFFTLAKLPNVAAAKMDARGLLNFNFKTTNEMEVNWYLKNKVGCSKATHDGRNFMFSNADMPGIVYLPKIGVPPSVIIGDPEIIEKPKLIPMWVGLGLKVGGQSAVGVSGGQDYMTAFVQNFGDPSKHFEFMTTTRRLVSIGVGASGGVSLVIISGIIKPPELNALKTSGVDFNVAVGGNLNGILKFEKIRKVAPFIRVFKKMGILTPAKLKEALKSPDIMTNLYKSLKSCSDFKKSDLNGKPEIIVVDLWGAGGELSLFYGETSFQVLIDFTN